MDSRILTAAKGCMSRIRTCEHEWKEGSHSNLEILTLDEVESMVDSAESKVRRLLGQNGPWTDCTAKGATLLYPVAMSEEQEKVLM